MGGQPASQPANNRKRDDLIRLRILGVTTLAINGINFVTLMSHSLDSNRKPSHFLRSPIQHAHQRRRIGVLPGPSSIKLMINLRVQYYKRRWLESCVRFRRNKDDIAHEKRQCDFITITVRAQFPALMAANRNRNRMLSCHKISISPFTFGRLVLIVMVVSGSLSWTYLHYPVVLLCEGHPVPLFCLFTN